MCDLSKGLECRPIYYKPTDTEHMSAHVPVVLPPNFRVSRIHFHAQNSVLHKCLPMMENQWKKYYANKI